MSEPLTDPDLCLDALGAVGAEALPAASVQPAELPGGDAEFLPMPCDAVLPGYRFPAACEAVSTCTLMHDDLASNLHLLESSLSMRMGCSCRGGSHPCRGDTIRQGPAATSPGE